MNGNRNSTCSLQSLNARLLVVPICNRSPSTILPPCHSSALLPLKRTMAPSGGLAPSVGLLRMTWSRLNSVPLSVLPASLPSAIVPPQPLPEKVVLPSSILAVALILVLASQPSPGSPPG